MSSELNTRHSGDDLVTDPDRGTKFHTTLSALGLGSALD